MADTPPSTRPGSSSDVDSDMQSNQPLFLTFTPGLASLSSAKRQAHGQRKKSNVYKVSGVNILNRNSVDSKTALERLQRRRENHNFVERRRRDNINQTITTLATLLPPGADDSAKRNKGSVLQMAVDYIRALQDENRSLGGTAHLAALPCRSPRDSRASSPQHSQDGVDDDDDDSVPLSSTAASSPGIRKRSGSDRASPAEKRTRPGPARVQPPPVFVQSTPHSPQRVLGPTQHALLPPIGAIAAQSMPSSPSFRADPRAHVLAHPFFNSDVSSIRHHLQLPQPASGFQSPSSNFQSPAPSLQATPLTRPARDTPAPDRLALPPIAGLQRPAPPAFAPP
ncbi:hypothetical protein GGF46_001156 [Coemansia sp. RSA 552]|nr:hypothetical protein GGF46_001156 [Coemansia sp. RSA 552]